jgi:thymidine kinase
MDNSSTINMGSLDVVFGGMWAGKSSELIRIATQLDHLEIPYVIINHSIDNRYGYRIVSTNNKKIMQCISLENICDIWDLTNENYADNIIKYKESRVILVDESQFFTDLKKFVVQAKDVDGKNIKIFGLHADCNKDMFQPIIDILGHARNITKLNALCSLCKDGTIAPHTLRLNNNTEQIEVGVDNYIAVCDKHWLEKTKEKRNTNEKEI